MGSICSRTCRVPVSHGVDVSPPFIPHSQFITNYPYSLCIGLAVLALSTALNAISHHGTCTVTFSFVAYLIITIVGSIRKIERLGWILWIGFASIVTAVMIVVIAVTIPDRPAAAPQTGPFDLGFGALPPPGTTFATAWAASIAIYASSANTSGYVSSPHSKAMNAR